MAQADPFAPDQPPRVYALPPGADFALGLVQGMLARFGGGPPEALARVTLIVNTSRMARRVRALFDAGPARLLPRIVLLSDLDMLAPPGLPAPVSKLRRRLELAQLVGRLLDSQPDLAPRSAIFALADSLAALLDEMQGEQVDPGVLDRLDVSDSSGHWARALTFLRIVTRYLDLSSAAPDVEARQRMVVQALVAEWQRNPPRDPVIVAGSTASRGTTRSLMQAVAALPGGAVVLPGYDGDLPADILMALDPDKGGEDHPQYRFAAFLHGLDADPSQVRPWHDTAAPNPARNRLVSLALRPAPVTDAWLREGPLLQDLDTALAEVTLVEAPGPRDEALAIAMRLRQAAETGQSAALITPDRMLTRQVTAALARWDLLPDDSAGTPLQLSPPGRFLRHVSTLFHHDLTLDQVLTLLKHPLAHSGGARGRHLLLTRDLELHLRKEGLAYPGAEALVAWGAAHPMPQGEAWARWLATTLTDRRIPGDHPLSDWIGWHLDLAERLAGGSDAAPGDSGGLWDRKAGQKARETVEMLRAEAEAGGAMTAADYDALAGSILAAEEVRDRDEGHPGLLILGTLEARVQGADLVILAGLNEGTWPEAPAPDTWLNRTMRRQAGLLLPERRIGLSAHDFQQAMGARQIWITRSVRSDEAQTVPARWLGRLTNLLGGLKETGGEAALKEMRARGQAWLDRARVLETPVAIPPAPRPAPNPPHAARPRKLSVTEIRTLVRDPYAIYARHILGLRPLDPLVPTADARLRGIALHRVAELFLRRVATQPEDLTAPVLRQIAEAVLAAEVGWPAIRLMWQSHVDGIAEAFVAAEADRLAVARPVDLELRGRTGLDLLGFELTARADRIDRDAAGGLHIFDYKSGKPPGPKEQRAFDKQLLLEIVMTERGAFRGIDPAPVVRAAYLGLGSDLPVRDAEVSEAAQVWTEFERLIAGFLTGNRLYTARKSLWKDADTSDYDQLARFGEWDATTQAERLDLT